MWWCGGTALPVKAPVMFNFMPSWWHRNFGIEFGERLFTDVEHRAGTYRSMTRLAHERFGDVGLGSAEPELIYFTDDVGNATIPAALGAELWFPVDMYPESRPFNDEQIDALTVPADITKLYPISEVLRQADYIRNRYGVDVKTGWNCHSPQNICVQFRGAEFFTFYFAEPERARRMLDLSMDIITQTVNHCAGQGAFAWTMVNGRKAEYYCGLNCTVAMAGPRVYEEWLLPYEQKLSALMSSHGRSYAIHHCGRFDEYAGLYSRVENVVWLEIGSESDLRLALDAFPGAHVQYIIAFSLLDRGSASEIRDAVRGLVDIAGPDIGRVSFAAPDIEYGTPDENVRAVVEALLA